jgi:hypothetical protein
MWLGKAIGMATKVNICGVDLSDLSGWIVVRHLLTRRKYLVMRSKIFFDSIHASHEECNKLCSNEVSRIALTELCLSLVRMYVV